MSVAPEDGYRNKQQRETLRHAGVGRGPEILDSGLRRNDGILSGESEKKFDNRYKPPPLIVGEAAAEVKSDSDLPLTR
jgi:hypothetical protein